MTVPSAEAEQTASLVMHELANYRKRELLEKHGEVGRVTMTSIQSTDLPLAYSAVVSIVAITEGFFTTTLQAHVNDAFSLNSSIMHDAHSYAIQQIESDWIARFRNARRWFGIDILNDPSITRMKGYIETRNAIVHGVGQLTRRQLKGDGGRETAKLLATVGIRFVGGRMEMGPSSVATCARDCCSAILCLDRAARNSALQPAPS